MAKSNDNSATELVKQAISPNPANIKPEKRRKARVQLTFAAKTAMDRARPNVGDASIYNVYYDKWYTEGINKKQGTIEPAMTRCDPELDSGWTMGELECDDAFFCVFFARGCCGKGHECKYLHRIPNDSDGPKYERTRDCFGREKHRLDSNNMSGIGSFERDNRTLYISKIGAYGRQVQDVIRKHFEKFGEITALRCVPSKNISFVTFRNRLNAEFAKEAMDAQKLDKSETLIVRWGAENTNENVKKGMVEKAQEQFVQKLFTDPSVSQTAAFLHDTIPDDDLNLYYKQEEGGEYSDYLYKNRLPQVEQKQIELPKIVHDTPTILLPHVGVEKVSIPLNLSAKRSIDSIGGVSKPVAKKPSGLSALANYDSDSE